MVKEIHKKNLEIAISYLNKCIGHLAFIVMDSSSDRLFAKFATDILNEVKETKERVETAFEENRYF